MYQGKYMRQSLDRFKLFPVIYLFILGVEYKPVLSTSTSAYSLQIFKKVITFD
jgi:hypothetical protein